MFAYTALSVYVMFETLTFHNYVLIRHVVQHIFEAFFFEHLVFIHMV